MVEVSKLTTQVDRLIKDVQGLDDKVDALRHQATWVKGGIAVAVFAFGLFAWFLTNLINGKLDAVTQALRTTAGGAT